MVRQCPTAFIFRFAGGPLAGVVGRDERVVPDAHDCYPVRRGPEVGVPRLRHVSVYLRVRALAPGFTQVREAKIHQALDALADLRLLRTSSMQKRAALRNSAPTNGSRGDGSSRIPNAPSRRTSAGSLLLRCSRLLAKYLACSGLTSAGLQGGKSGPPWVTGRVGSSGSVSSVRDGALRRLHNL